MADLRASVSNQTPQNIEVRCSGLGFARYFFLAGGTGHLID